MKNLEPGCLAVVINSAAGNNGKVVTVGNYLGQIFEKCLYNYWEISPKLKGITIRTMKTTELLGHAPEHQLLRIDVYEEDETVEKEELVDE